MDHKESRNLRLYILLGLFLVVMLIFLGVLYNTQVNNYDHYQALSVRSIAKSERVEAARGNITDRNGKVLVSSRSSYNLTFDSSLLKDGEDESEAILRLLEFCQEQQLSWSDSLPVTQAPPFSYTIENLGSTLQKRFLVYLKDLSSVTDALGAYLLEHPELLEETDEEGNTSNPADEILEDTELSDAQKADDLVDLLEEHHITAQLLTEAGISASDLISLMREDFDIPASFTEEEARLVLGVQYEQRSRYLSNATSYVLVEDIDVETISLLNDGGYSGAQITSSSVREYETTYASHILGYTTPLYRDRDNMEELAQKGYDGDDYIGRTGVEAAFEDYLRGTDGERIVSTNQDGKVTGEYYSEEPIPGNTVELTIDLDLQQAVEEALTATVSRMNAADGDESRGAGAVVLAVDSAEVLAMASYPMYDLATFRQTTQAYNAVESDPGRPLYNRATQGTYAPGSTLKPLTAVAALEEGKVTLTEIINDTGRWRYPGAPEFGTYCWNRSGHGRLNITEAITVSCTYFFAEMGYRLQMDTLKEYLSAFGLGSSTGIEIGDAAGTLPSQNEGEDQSPWAGYGQANQLYTPLQLANYIATLVNGGEHREVHLLKAVKTYDNSEVVTVGSSEPINTIEISDSTLNAVKEGMHNLTTGSLAAYFRNCVVDAGAKTGTAQLGADIENNGVFVCFAPYDDPEIVLAMVIEHGGSGTALASTAVEILNAYFTADESGSTVTGENQLLP